MSVLISDETLRACQMEAAEFKQEIALLLFQVGRLTIGHASYLAQMPPIDRFVLNFIYFPLAPRLLVQQQSFETNAIGQFTIC